MRAFLIIHMLISVIVALTLVAFALESRCFSARIRKEGPRIVQSQSAGALLHPSSRKQQHTSTGLISHTRLELEEQKKESLALSNGEEDHRLVPNATASREFVTGTAGAGFGALVAELKGGLGSASIKLPNGITVAALIAVNALGSPMLGIDGHFRAATFERKREFGGFGLPEKLPENTDDLRIKFRDHSNGITNTTIGVVATDAVIDKAQAKRLAVAAHDGIAHAIWPAHTPLDGDLLFSLATGSSKITPNVNDWIDLSAASASVVARAISNAVYEAKSEKTDLHPSWKQVYAVKHR